MLAKKNIIDKYIPILGSNGKILFKYKSRHIYRDNIASVHFQQAATHFWAISSHFIAIHLFPEHFGFLKKKNCIIRENRVSGTVLMIQLTQNSPTCTYIGQNMRKRKPR